MIKLEFPLLRQTFKYDCGAIALEAVLAYYGIELREDHLLKQAGTTKKGTPLNGIVRTARHFGLKCHSRKMALDDLQKYLDKKIPVILVLQAWSTKPKVNWVNDWADGHYVVAIGYSKTRVYFQDPSSFKCTYLTINELGKRWHDAGADGKRYDSHGIAVFGRKPVFSSKAMEHMG